MSDRLKYVLAELLGWTVFGLAVAATGLGCVDALFQQPLAQFTLDRFDSVELGLYAWFVLLPSALVLWVVFAIVQWRIVNRRRSSRQIAIHSEVQRWSIWVFACLATLITGLGIVFSPVLAVYTNHELNEPEIGRVGWRFTFVIALILWFSYAMVLERIQTQRQRVSEGLDLGRELHPGAEFKDMDGLKAVWSGRLSRLHRDFLVDMLISPAPFTPRISERVEYQGRTVLVRTSTSIQVPKDLLEVQVVVPALIQARGELSDSLEVRLGDAIRVATMPKSETLAVLSLVLDDLIEDAFNSAKTQSKALLSTKEQVIQFAAEMLQSTEPYLAKFLEDGTKSAIDQVAKKSKLNADMVVRLLRAIGLLGDSYPILVRLPPIKEDSAAARISTQRVEMPQFRPKSAGNRFTRWIRHHAPGHKFLGVHPPSIRHPLAGADRAKSYHLQVVAPAGHYVGNHRVRLARLNSPARPESIAFSIAGSPGKAQPFTHLYVRHGSQMSRYVSQVTFRESPPGSLGEALVTSGVLAITVLAVWLSRGGLDREVFAFLIPIVLTGIGATSIWQGLISTREPFGGRAAARLSSIATLGLALWAVVVSALKAIPAIAVAPTVPDVDHWFHLAFADQWALIVVASFFVFVLTFITWTVTVRVEMRLLDLGERL